MADNESPIITKLSGETFRSWVAKRNVSRVASRAPIAAITMAPTEPITTTFVSTPITTARAAPAEVPNIAGSASGLLVAPCASAPATPSAAPTINAVAIRGMRICQSISAALVLAVGFKSAENKPSIWVAPTLNESATIASRKNRLIVRKALRLRICDHSESRGQFLNQRWGSGAKT